MVQGVAWGRVVLLGRGWGGALRDGRRPRAPILGFGAGPDGAGDPRSPTAPRGHGDGLGTWPSSDLAGVVG